MTAWRESNSEDWTTTANAGMMNDETTRGRDGNDNATTMMRQRRREKTVTNKKRGSGSRSIGGRMEATNDDGGEGIGAMRS